MQQKIDNYKKEAFAEYINSLSEDQIKEHEDKFCSQEDIKCFLLAYENSDVLGGLKVMVRDILFEKHKIKLGGLAGVWVKEGQQKKGIGLKMVTKAMGILKMEKCDVAYICTDIGRIGGFYRRVGFQNLNRPNTFLGKSGNRYFDNNGMVAPIGSVTIYTKVLNSNDAFDIGKGNW